jgi:hypothetical protein
MQTSIPKPNRLSRITGFPDSTFERARLRRGNLAHVRSLAATHNEIGATSLASNVCVVRHFIWAHR